MASRASYLAEVGNRDRHACVGHEDEQQEHHCQDRKRAELPRVGLLLHEAGDDALEVSGINRAVIVLVVLVELRASAGSGLSDNSRGPGGRSGWASRAPKTV